MARHPIVARFGFTGAVMLLALAGSAHAQSTLPSNGHVVAGSATIGAPAGATLSINQTSNRAVINWNAFSVGQPNTVVFVQPGSTAAVLNRVTGGAPSTIAGQIQANGQVYLVNPNGIAITSSGSVQVGGGFVASTLGISTDDFMSGNLSFTGDGASAGVSNAGSIAVGQGGYAALIGGTAANSGVITAPLGKVALGAGEQATLDLNGDGFMQVAAPTGATTAQGQALVSNSGQVSAAGGTVELRAATVATAIRDAVNMSGVIAANSVSGHDGSIVLDGGPGGGVEVSGTIDAAGQGAAQSGGAVRITGNGVALDAPASISASGEAGGGSVEVGGGPHGADPSLADAATTYVADGATIDASATGGGNGGTVSVWSNGTTVFNGAIRATGGPGGGDGGWVETSGEGILNVGASAVVGATATHGKSGSWLLDPNSNVDITNATTNDVCTSAGALTCAPSADTSTVAASVITSNVNGLGAGDNVVVTTTCGAGNTCTGAQAGTITVDAAISWTTPASLTLNAAGAITINQAISGTNAGSALSLTAGGAITQAAAGKIEVGTLTTSSVGGTTLGAANQVGTFAATNTTSGNISLTNSVPSMLVGVVSQSGGGGVSITNSGGVNLNGTIGAGAGTVTLISTGGSLDDAGPADIITAGVLTGSAATGVTLGSPELVGTLGPFTNTTSGNVAIDIGQSVVTSGLLSNAAPTGTFDLTLFNGGALMVGGGGITTANGDITLAANTMILGGAVNAGAASVSLTNATVGVAIDLGTAPGGGVLGLTQASLNEVTANVLRIGSSTAGALTITAPISAPAGWNVLTLINNGAITEQAGGSLTVARLRISSAGPVALDAPSNNIQTFAADSTASDSIVDGANLTIGIVDGVSGISTSGGAAVNVTSSGTLGESGGGLVDTTGTLTIRSVGGTTLGAANQVGTFVATNTGPGNISLTNNVPSMLVGVVSQSGGGGVSITNSGSVNLNGTIGAGAGTVTLISTGGSLDDAGPADIITAGVLTGSAATGVTLGSPELVGTLGPFTNTTSGNVAVDIGQSVVTSGLLSNAAPTGTFDLTLFNGAALMVGGGGITTANGDITLAANTMILGGAVNAGAASVLLTNAAAGVAIDLGTAPGGGVLGLTQASLNEVTANVLRIGSSTAGALTITAPISAPAGWNTLTLINNGAISEQAGDSLTVANLRVSSAGPVALDAASNNIQTFAADSTASDSIVDASSLTIGTVDGVSGVATSNGAAVNLTSIGTLSESGGGLVSTTGTLTTSSVGGATLGGANQVSGFNATNTTSGDIFLANTAPTLSISGVSQSGGGAVSLVNTGSLALNGSIAAGSGAVNLTAGGPISEGAGAVITAASLTGSSVGGATLTDGNLVAAFGGWTDAGGGSAGLSFNDAEALTIVGAVGSASGPVSLVTSSGNLTLASGAAVAGDGVALATPGAFVKDAGAGALTASGGGRWLVYSSAPGANTFGGLDSGDTAIWNATYASAPPGAVTEAGDRYLFAEGQTLTVTTTNVSKVYGQGATAAVASAYTVSGFAPGVAGAFLGDSATTTFTGTPSVTSPGSATLASVAGGPYAITAGAGSLTALDGYTVTFVDTGVVTVSPAVLSISIVGDPTKVYDGLTTAELLSGDFALSGFVAGQGATVSALIGAYNSSNVVSATTLTASLTAGDFTANAGTSLSNYTLPTTASGAGQITPATLTASIVGDPTKVYDGTTTAALVSGEFSLSGFVAGQGATLSPPSSGAYNSPNVANATTVTAALTAGDFTANAGTLLSNYTLPTTASGAGAITPATLTASIIGDPTRVYNGATAAALVSGDFALSGFVAGQGATVSALTGAYNSPNVVSATTVTAALTAGDFTANAGTLLSNYSLPITATGAGAITPRAITVTADNLSRLVDELNPPLTFTVTMGNLVNGDSLSGTLATSANIDSPLGSYAITQGTLAASQNYSLSFVDGELVVTAPDFGVSPEKYIPLDLGLAPPPAGPTPCSPDDLAAMIGRTGKVVVFGPQGTQPSGEGGACSAFSTVAGPSGPALSEGLDVGGERGFALQ